MCSRPRISTNLFVLTLLATGMLLSCEVNWASAANELYLLNILEGNTLRTGTAPQRLWADEYGGAFEVTINHTDKFKEKVKVSWNFNKKNVKLLRVGDKYQINTQIGFLQEGSEKDDPNQRSYGHRSIYKFVTHQGSTGSSGLVGDFIKSGELPKDPSRWNKSVLQGGRSTVVPRKYSSYAIGQGSATYEVTKSIGSVGGLCYMSLHFDGYAYGPDKKKDCVYEIIYLYVSGGKPPAKSPTLARGGARPPKRPDSSTVSTGGGASTDPNNDTRGGNSGGPNGNTTSDPTSDTNRPNGGGPVTGTGTGRPGNPNTGPGGGGSVPGPEFDPEIFVQLPRPVSVPLPDFIPQSSRSKLLLFADRVRVRAGDVVRVPIHIRNANDVASLKVRVNTNRSVAIPNGTVVQGGITSSSLFEKNPRDRSGVLIGVSRDNGFSGDGAIAYITYQAVGKPGDRTPVELTVTTANNSALNNLDVTTISGEIQIVDDSGLTKGDCDGDGDADELDARCALRMSVNLIPVRLQLDVDNDGSVTPRDATIILQNARR